MPEQQEIKREKVSSERGAEALIKEEQNYLLFRFLDILAAATRNGDLDKAYGAGVKRMRRLDPRDQDANSKFAGILSRTQNSSILRRIPPNVLSGLVPSIKVYKVVYPYRYAFKNKGEMFYRSAISAMSAEQYKLEAALEVPFDYGVHANQFQSETERQTSITDVILGRQKGYLDLANLVSFNYQFIGTNPAEVEACITANMKLKFQTIDALLEERSLVSGDVEIANSFALTSGGVVPISTKKEKLTVGFKYSDLVNQGLNTSPDYYRLKVEVGYADVTPEYIKNLLLDGTNVRSNVFSSFNIGETPGVNDLNKFCDSLASAINDTKIILYVYPVRHEINFSENGTIELNIDFHGAVEQVMSESETNVLLTSAEGQKIVERVRSLEKEKAGKREDAAKAAERDPALAEESRKRQEQIDTDYERKVKKELESLPYIYKSFINTIYSESLVKSITYAPEDLGVVDEGTFADDNQISVDTKEASIRQKERGEITQEDVKKLALNLNYIAENKDEVEKQAKMLFQDSTDPGAKIFNTEIDGRIRFIFLQDLIAQAMKVMERGDLATQDLYLVLGNMILPVAKGYRDLVETSVPGALSFFEQNNAYAMLVNIGQLPISLNLFNKWFYETVIKPNKYQYNLRNFLYDVMELVRVSTLQIFGTNTFSVPGSRILSSIVSVDGTVGEQLKTANDPLLPIDTNLDTSFFRGKMKVSNKSKVTNILYYFVPSTVVSNINVLDVAENDKKNIFTFLIGTNTGLLKRMSYKKMDIPGMREARATQEGELRTGTLRMKYDADIEMYGPCLFRPGDYIIINPVFLSKSSTEISVARLASDIGLGGIYMVLKTNTEASRDGVTTKLDTVFQSYANIIPRTPAAKVRPRPRPRRPAPPPSPEQKKTGAKRGIKPKR
jgi:hypothetical protein